MHKNVERKDENALYRAGFTLMEVLVALLVLMIAAGSTGYCYRVFAGMQRRDSALAASVASATEFVENAIENPLPCLDTNFVVPVEPLCSLHVSVAVLPGGVTGSLPSRSVGGGKGISKSCAKCCAKSAGGNLGGSIGGSIGGSVSGSIGGSIGGSVSGSIGGSVSGSIGGSIGDGHIGLCGSACGKCGPARLAWLQVEAHAAGFEARVPGGSLPVFRRIVYCR